ncbi:MAG: hypothetical protein Q9220_003211 [cf. Caloplaca sp. 1 TL-2023]
MSSPSPPPKTTLLLFPAFEPLDAMGPLNALADLARHTPLTLSIIAPSLSPISTCSPLSKYSPGFGVSVSPTHTIANPPAEIEVLVVPGGDGLLLGEDEGGMVEDLVGFVRETYPRLQYIISICNGATLLARAGILNGKRATTNKKLFDEIIASSGSGESSKEKKIEWVRKARWVEDGNVWTSSGVSAGVDCVLAWIGRVWGEDVAEGVAGGMEWNRWREGGEDPWA